MEVKKDVSISEKMQIDNPGIEKTRP